MGQQLSFQRKHRGVVPIDGPWSRMSKTSHLKLKCEVSRTKKKVQECDYVFGCRRRSREERNGFVKADVVKEVFVYVYLRDFFTLTAFHDYSLCLVCILPQPAFYS